MLIGFELDRKKTGFGTNRLLAHALAGRRLPTSELKHIRVCLVVEMLLSKLVRSFNEWKLHPSHIIETGFTFRHAVTKASVKHIRQYWCRSRASFYVDQYELLLDT